MDICVETICRTCMETGGNFFKIFGEGEPIFEMLRSFSTIEPTKNDGLPENVCITCFSELNRAYSFKQKCERSEFILRTYIKQSTISKIKQQNIYTKLDYRNHDFIDKNIVEYKKVNQQKIENDSPVKHQELSDYYKIESCAQTNHSETPSYAIIQQQNVDDNICNVNGMNVTDTEIEDNAIDDNSSIYQYKRNNTTSIERSYNTENNINTDLQSVTSGTNSINDEDIIEIDKNSENSMDTQPVNTSNFHLDSRHIYEINDLCKHNTRDHITNDGANYEIVNIEIDTTITDNQIESLQTCSICSFEFENRYTLESHILQDHQVLNQSNMISDNLNNTDENEQYQQLSLEVVSEELSIETTVGSHILNCSKCNATFVNVKSLTIHENSNKCTQKSFECIICNKIFAKKRNLTRHLKIHNNNDEFKCVGSSKEFSRKNHLLTQFINRSIIRKYQCAECPKSFNIMSTLKDHIRTHNGERPFLCSICGKGFSQSTNLKQHLMRHNKTKPFKCKECEFSCVSKGELNAHLRKHSGDHPFVCDVCGSGFTTSSSLVKHKRIHTGERPYGCDFCPSRFTALGTLKNHRRTHTGERPYVCQFQFCKKSFAQKSDCVSHTRIHTGERRYNCTFCGHAFQQSSTLKSHLKTHKNQEMLSIKQSEFPLNENVKIENDLNVLD